MADHFFDKMLGDFTLQDYQKSALGLIVGVDRSSVGDTTVIAQIAQLESGDVHFVVIDEITEFTHPPISMEAIRKHEIKRVGRKPQPHWAARNQAPRSPRKPR